MNAKGVISGQGHAVSQLVGTRTFLRNQLGSL
jgi:hypothetical protein